MTLPIYDGKPTHRTPVVTWGFVAACCLIFAITAIGHTLPLASAEFGFIPSALSAAIVDRSMPSALPLVSYALLHGTTWHLLSNMLFMLVFGKNVEDQLGRATFILFILLAAAVAALAHWAYSPQSALPTIGASGVISAVLGHYVILFPKQPILALVALLPLRLPAYFVVGLWFTLQVLNGATGAAAAANIAWAAHLGGFAFGVVWAAMTRRTPR